MLKSELIQRVRAQNPHLHERQAEGLVNAILDEIRSAIARGDRVELRGFGVFSAKVRPAHVGRDPRTGGNVQVPRRVAPYFRTSREMLRLLNPPSGIVW
jgi:integration host factor subunit beta